MISSSTVASTSRIGRGADNRGRRQRLPRLRDDHGQLAGRQQDLELSLTYGDSEIDLAQPYNEADQTLTNKVICSR